MIPADFDAFAALMDDAATLLGKPALGERQMGLYFAALADQPFAAVKAATLAHMRDPQRGRFMPTPADVIAQINGILEQQDGRPGAEEAWALCLRCQDEAETIVWTAEMAQAWEVARAVLPDEIGARMAFKEAYARMTDEARRARQPAAWSVSLGHDPQRRTAAVNAAVDAGRLLESQRLEALPAPRRGVTLLTYVGELAARSDAPEDCRVRLLEIRDRLAQQAEVPSEDATAKALTAEMKEAAMARVIPLLARQAAQQEAASAAHGE